MKNITASIILQTLTALTGILNVPLLIMASSLDVFSQYVFMLSISSIISLFTSGLSLNLSSSKDCRRNTALNFYFCIIVSLTLMFSFTQVLNIKWKILFVMIFTIITIEAAKGVSISIQKFQKFQVILLLLKLVTTLFLFILAQNPNSEIITAYQLALVMMFPATILFTIILKTEYNNLKHLYLPFDYINNTKSLTAARILTGSQEHIVKLAIITYFTSEAVAVFEFINRLCKQSKSIIDNALSFLIRSFENEQGFNLRWLIAFQLSTITLFSILTFTFVRFIYSYLNYEANLLQEAVIVLIFSGYMALLANTIFLHYSAAKNNFRFMVKVSSIRFMYTIGIVTLVHLSFLGFQSFVIMFSLGLIVVGGANFCKLTRILKI